MTTKSPNPIDVHVGARVRMRRMMLGRSQEWLANALGLTFQQVQKYEKGTNRVSGSRILEIGRALGVPPAYFFEGAPGGEGAPLGSPEQAAFDDFVASRHGLDIATAFPRLSPKVQLAVVHLVRTAAGVA